MIENVLHFALKALFVGKIFDFFLEFFGHVEKQPYKKAKVNFKVYDAINWEANYYNTHIV